MTIAAPPKLFTPDDLLRMPDAVNYELVDGKLVERNMGMESSLIGMRIGHRLSSFVEDRRLGLLFGADAGYQCFPDAPDKVRKPDVSFIRSGRLPGDLSRPRVCGHLDDLPGLIRDAIEIVDAGHGVIERL